MEDIQSPWKHPNNFWNTHINPQDPYRVMEKEKVLIQNGLSRTEAKAYLSLLRIGEGTAGKIAEKARLHRSNVYDAADKLVEKGFAAYHQRKRLKVYTPADPDNLLRIAREKVVNLRKLMPQLRLEKELSRKKTTAEVYEGLKALRETFYRLLEHEKTIYAFGIPAYVPEALKSFIDGFHEKRMAKKVVMKHVYNEDAKERIRYLNSMKYTEAAYLPEEYNAPVTTMACGEYVLLITWRPMSFVKINNKVLAESYTKYCEFMLKNAKGKRKRGKRR